MSKYSDFLTEQLKDPALKAEYDALEPEFSVIQAMIDARKAAGLTQKQLARQDWHRTVRHQQTGNRQCKSVSADTATSRTGDGHENEDRVYSLCGIIGA